MRQTQQKLILPSLISLHYIPAQLFEKLQSSTREITAFHSVFARNVRPSIIRKKLIYKTERQS